MLPLVMSEGAHQISPAGARAVPLEDFKFPLLQDNPT